MLRTPTPHGAAPQPDTDLSKAALRFSHRRPAAHAPRVPVQVEQVHVARQAVRQHAARDGVAVQAAQTVGR